MNLDDSFTDKLQKRRKARKDYLKVKMVGSSARRKSNTLIEEQQIPDENNNEYQDSPKCPYVEEMILEHEVKDDPIEEVKENIYSQQQEMEESNYIKEDKLAEEKVPQRARDPAVLRKKHSAQDDLNEKNISRDTQQIHTPPTHLFSTKTRGLCSTRSRLARLAADINGWEDDLTRAAISSTPSTKKSPTVVFEEVDDTLNSSFEPSNLPLAARKAIFEQAAMKNVMAADINALEDNLVQPTVHTTSYTKEAPVSVAEELEDTLNCSFEPSNLPLSERKAIFEQAAMAVDINGWKDNLMQSFVPTTCTKKTPFVTAEKVDDILNCSFEPSNLPLSERKAIFEQAAMGNKVQSQKQTFKSKGSMGRRSAMFEKSPKNKFRFRTPHQKPTNTSPVNPSTNVGNTLKSVTALRPTKPSVLKGNPTRPSAASTRRPTNPSIASTRSPINPSIASTRRPTNPSIASTKSPTNPSVASKRSPANPSVASKRSPANPSVASKRSPANPSVASKRSPANPSVASKRSPANPSTASKRSPANPFIASTGRSARQSATLSRSSSKSSVTSTKSPVRLTSTLTRGPSKPSTELTISPVIPSAASTKRPTKPSIASTRSPVGPSAALSRSLSKLSIAPTKKTTGSSAALTRTASPSIISAGSPAFKCPAKPGATGRHTTSTPTKSFILKPPTCPSQQQCAKYTGTKPKIKQPLSSLVKHFEKLSSSTSWTPFRCNRWISRTFR